MSRDKKSKMGKLLTLVSTSISFMEKVRHRPDKKVMTFREEGDIDDGPGGDGAPGPGGRASSSRGDERCPSCDVTHCRHEVPIRCLPGDALDGARGSSAGSSVITSSDDASRASLTRSVSLRDENAKYTEEVELTEDQKAELKQAFSMFEKTGKGKIPARDLGELLRCLGWNPSEQDLEEARHELELTARGTISFAEVEAYIARRGGIYYGNNAEEDIMVAFQVLDKHGSGRITVSDFRHFMTTMGERMSLEEAEELIARSTQDGKDYIEYRDLVHAVQLLPT